MSKLLESKLAYLETDIRQNLSTVITNYVSFNENVQEADKKAFINFEFKLLLERLEQIRKDGTTKVAPTDADEPKLGYRTSVPYPAGGITEGIQVGKYEEETLAEMLEENLSEDIKNFYIYKERSSSFINTLLLVDDLQSATLDDFDKLVCSKEITKVMRPLSDIDRTSGTATIPFYIDNYLKDDDAIFINKYVRENTKTYIHEKVVTKIVDKCGVVFKIVNGIQPYASTLKIDESDLERMQMGLGIEIAPNEAPISVFSNTTEDPLPISAIIASAEDTEAMFNVLIDNMGWINTFLRNRIDEYTYSKQIDAALVTYKQKETAKNTAQSQYDSAADADKENKKKLLDEAIKEFNEISDKCKNLVNSLLAIETKINDYGIIDKKDFLFENLNYFFSKIYYETDALLDRETFELCFPDMRHTRIKTDIKKYQVGLFL
jgi:hypothetical protein